MKKEKGMLYRINFERTPQIGSLVERIVIERFKEIDKHLINKMYELYKDTDISEVYVIDETEFARYLKATLPQYLKMKGKNKL